MNLQPAPQYLLILNGRNLGRWDATQSIILGRDGRYALEVKNTTARIRDFSRIEASSVAIEFELPASESQIALNRKQTDILKIIPLKQWKPIHLTRKENHELPRTQLAPRTLSHEDQSFRKLSLGLCLSLIVLLASSSLFGSKQDPLAVESTSKIPEKYAKLILTPPKKQSSSSSSTAVSHSATQKATVARAFQSKSIQSNLNHLLKTSLTHYANTPGGRSIQSLSQRIQGDQSGFGQTVNHALEQETTGKTLGATKLGSSSGYGNASGHSVQGQGSGQVSIALDTNEASVEEGLTKEEVAKVIHSHLHEIRFCYENAILSDPNLAGKLLIDFKINSKGIVPVAQVGEASLKDATVTKCLLTKLKNWKFPEPRGGVVVAVSYPFIFKSLTR